MKYPNSIQIALFSIGTSIAMAHNAFSTDIQPGQETPSQR